jgi:3-hydroxyacyl-CoA dehydrogenase
LYIKTDKKQFPVALRQISPKAGMPLVIICRGEFTSSEEVKVFLGVVRSADSVMADMKRKVRL